MKRRILSIIFTLAMILSIMPAVTLTASAADEDVIEISDAAGLAAFRDRVNNGEMGLNATLTADIDLSEVCGEEIGNWTPIGLYISYTSRDNKPFTGIFDGGGHKIIGLYINAPDSDCQGLFSYVEEGGTVKNLGVVNGSVTSGGNAGGVVGRIHGGMVTNCYYTGAVSASGSYVSVGGVVGCNFYDNTVTNCYNTGAVSGNGSTANVGGVVGLNQDSMVQNCYNTGAVSASGNHTGGVVGWNYQTGTVANCYYGGDCTLTEGIGTDDKQMGETTNKTPTAAELGTDDWIYSPILGRPVLASNPEGGLGTEEYPYEIPNLATLEWFRDYVNDTDAGISGKLTDDITMDNTSWTPVGTYISDTSSDNKPYTGIFDGGGHTISGLYINSTSEGCYGLFGYVGSGGTVKNVNVEGGSVGVSLTGVSNMTYYIYAGGIAAVNGGMVEDCHYTTGSVSVSISFSSVSNTTVIYPYGGIVGKNTGTVQNCHNTGSLSGGLALIVSGNNSFLSHRGGVAGENAGTVTNCYSTGSVSGGDGYTGGVVGYVTGTVENCYNTGAVSGDYAGGVAGYNDGGRVTNCYNGGRIRSGSPSTFYGGGVVAYNDGIVTNCYNAGEISADMPSTVYGGGVVGYNAGTVTNCYNAGGMSADMPSTVYGGGVVGYNTGTVTNCYNTGMVPSREMWVYALYAGGVVGYNDGGRVENCYNIGSILDNGRQISCAGGVVGQNDNGGAVTNCYYLDSCAAEGVTFTNTEGDSKTAAQFASGEEAWLLQNGQSGNIPQVWGQTVGSGTPLLISSEIGKGAPRVYKVIFTGDNVSLDPIYTNGGTVTEPTGPAAPDDAGEWIFGWYADGGTQWDFDADTVTGDTILTAKWKRIYSITVEEAENGTVTASLDKAAGGEPVTLTVKPDDGYQLKTLTVTAQDGTPVTVADDNTFVMPASDVTVKAEFEKKTDAGGNDKPMPTPGKPSGSSSSDTPGPGSSSSANSVTVSNPDAANGTVRSDVSSAKAGDTVTVSSEADIGYISAAPVVTDKNGNAVPVTKNADGTYSFTMPEGGVTVTGSYVTPGQLFSDVSDSAWYRNGLAYVVENGLMTGYGKGKFAPGDELSRAMLAQILYNAEDRPGVDGDGSFTDVSSSAWYIDAIAWAAANGIVAGYGNGLYGPEDAITREQLAVMLWRYAGQTAAAESNLTAFADAGEISAWAADAMAWAVSNGIIEGKGNGVLDPKGQATRAEAAAMLMRFLSR